MMLRSLIVLSLSAALNLVLASSVTLTSPEANDVWKAGSTVEIKWKVNDKTTGPIRLQYASGPSKALVVNGVIADSVEASAGKYSWKIPSDFKAKRYVIEAGPSANDLSFAGYIHIEGGKKATTKKHTTTKKHSTTKKHTTVKKHTKSTKKHTTTKAATGGKKVCVGYRENDIEKVSCHFVSDQHIKKTTKKVTKHKTTKKN